MFGYSNYPFPLYRNYNRYNRNSLNNPFITANIRHSYPPVSRNEYANHEESKVSSKIESKSIQNEAISNTENRNSKKEEKSSQNEFLEIFGIKLYFDDLMIISLLFFLYSEGVNDYYLFITLILLLLT